MKLYAEGKNYKLYQGNMLDLLDVIQPNSVDSIVTDPPYELNFMNKGWDNSGIAFQIDTWKKCLDVLKPGGYLLAFGGSRTFHRIACAIEDAGFEIRDTIMWLYSTGFPKSMSISKGIEAKETYGAAGTVYKKKIEMACDGETYIVKQNNNGAMGEPKEFERKDYVPTSELAKQWDGWGTCLKPAYEPIIVARKPCEGSCIDNVITYGVGGINIDECRVPFEDTPNPATNPLYRSTNGYKTMCGRDITPSAFALKKEPMEMNVNTAGRFPSNVILTYDETDKDEVCGGFPDSSVTGSRSAESTMRQLERRDNRKGATQCDIGGNVSRLIEYTDSGSTARYFYCAKASNRDREEGCDSLPDKQRFQQGNYSQSPVCSVCGKTFNGTNDHSLCGENTMVYQTKEDNTIRKNTHPTVKPVDLMQYLVRLVTPKGGTILDPFNGSGSTGKAAMYENKDREAGYTYLGIELSDEYLDISNARIQYVINIPVQFKLF